MPAPRYTVKLEGAELAAGKLQHPMLERCVVECRCSIAPRGRWVLLPGERRVDQVAHVPDDDLREINARVLEDIELLERRLSRDAGVRENRNVGRDMRAADGSKYFAFVFRDLVPGADLAERADDVVIGLLRAEEPRATPLETS